MDERSRSRSGVTLTGSLLGEDWQLSEGDRAELGKSERHEVVRQMITEAFRNDVWGLVDDMLGITKPWGFRRRRDSRSGQDRLWPYRRPRPAPARRLARTQRAQRGGRDRRGRRPHFRRSTRHPALPVACPTRPGQDLLADRFRLMRRRAAPEAHLALARAARARSLAPLAHSGRRRRSWQPTPAPPRVRALR
jgi:hypothetical protein